MRSVLLVFLFLGCAESFQPDQRVTLRENINSENPVIEHSAFNDLVDQFNTAFLEPLSTKREVLGITGLHEQITEALHCTSADATRFSCLDALYSSDDSNFESAVHDFVDRYKTLRLAFADMNDETFEGYFNEAANTVFNPDVDGDAATAIPSCYRAWEQEAGRLRTNFFIEMGGCAALLFINPWVSAACGVVAGATYANGMASADTAFCDCLEAKGGAC